jgi:transmembrane sensor
MDQQETYLLLTRWLTGEASPEEREELEWLFVANPELRRLVTLLSDLRSAPPKEVSAEEEQQMMERGWEQIKKGGLEKPDSASKILTLPVVRKIGGEEQPLQPTIIHKTRWKWIAAASIFLVLSAAGWLYTRTRLPNPGPARTVTILAAERGARKTAHLPDGTKLWLNAGSRIVLAAGFSQNNRELTLEGEACFEVLHDEKHPFIIHTGAVEVRVLGTTLNVRAYPGDPSIETTLIDGKAEIGLAGNPQSAILLRPNEKVIIPNEPAMTTQQDRRNNTVTSQNDNSRSDNSGTTNNGESDLPVRYVRRTVIPDRTDGTIAETSWTNDKLVFRNEILGSMSSRLERWYDVRIIFDDNRYQQDTISGTFPDIPVGDVMHALQLTEKFHYRMSRDTIHIW